MEKSVFDKFKIALVDDHALVRAGIRSLLEQMPDVEVVLETSDGRRVGKQLRDVDADLLLLDIALPGLNGLDVAARVRREHENLAIIMLSMYSNEEYVLQALRSGANGYLLKDSATAELELALQAVRQGKTYLSPGISKTLIDEYLQRPDKAKSPLERLTARQREILQLVAEGHTTRRIAELLSVSVKTVETHRAQLMTRLEIRDVAGLVRYAVRTGLVSADH